MKSAFVVRCWIKLLNEFFELMSAQEIRLEPPYRSDDTFVFIDTATYALNQAAWKNEAES